MIKKVEEPIKKKSALPSFNEAMMMSSFVNENRIPTPIHFNSEEWEVVSEKNLVSKY